MAISLRLDKKLENQLSKVANSEGKSKSDLVRTLIAEFLSNKRSQPSSWDLGKDVFGRYGSGKGNLSINRKSILREKLNAKKSRR